MKFAWAGAAVVLLALTGLYVALSTASKRAQGLAAFHTIAPIFQSPRCMNCHRSDLPRIRDSARDHVPRVRPASDGAGEGGERCSICHRDENNPLTRIPGAPGWRMPPYEMSWDGLEPADICHNLKDRRFNGDRDLAALHEHFRDDLLISWAWAPGPSRTRPALDYATFQHHVTRWIEAGAPCD